MGIICAALAVLAIYGHWPTNGPLITVSPETTYLTGPLREDGTVDYLQAINDRCSAGVTPENNAMVPLVQAVGPTLFGDEVRQQVLDLLGMAHDPVFEQGPHFQSLSDFIDDRDLESGEDVDSYDLLVAVMDRPWKRTDYPVAAAWLDANERPLHLVAEAANRSHSYLPAVAPPGNDAILCAYIPKLQLLRGLAKALSARVMLRMGEGDIDGAIDDAMVLHSLARGLDTRSFLIQWLVALAVDSLAVDTTQTLLTEAPLATGQAQRLLDHWRNATPLASVEEALEKERFFYLDCVTMLARGHLRDNFLPVNMPSSAVDWDRLLRQGNELWDRQIAALRVESPLERREALEAFDLYFEDRYGAEVQRDGEIPNAVLKWTAKFAPRLVRNLRTKYLGNLLIGILWPKLSSCSFLADKSATVTDQTVLALALFVYRGAHGRYPDDLSALVPAILSSVPNDTFSGKPFVYERTETGCRLYSVGMNFTDDGGLNADDMEDADESNIPVDADDLVIELTAP